MKSLTSRRLLFLLLFAFVALRSRAQMADHYRYAEAGILLGLTNYSGDMTENFIDFREFNLGYGAFVRYHLSRRFALKFHAYAGALSGDDAHAESLKLRALRFSTSFLEMAMVGELHLFRQSRYTNTGIHKIQISPYLYAGPGVTFASPDTRYYGPAELRNKYLKVPVPEDNLSGRFWIVPVGGGIRFDLFEQFVIGVEGGIRPVFADDLDGVRLNGNPEQGDWYYYGGMTVSFILAKSGKRFPF